jgi:hypothetical protein
MNRAGAEPCPPKAEARGSNPFGCAKNIIQINDLEAHVVAMSRRDILAEAPWKQLAKSCGEDYRAVVGQYGPRLFSEQGGRPETDGPPKKDFWFRLHVLRDSAPVRLTVAE